MKTLMDNNVGTKKGAAKAADRVTLFAAIRENQYEAMRKIAFDRKKSLAEVTREAIDVYLKSKLK